MNTHTNTTARVLDVGGQGTAEESMINDTELRVSGA